MAARAQDTDIGWTFKSVADIRKAMDRTESHWFDADTMRFFHTQIPNNGKVYGGRVFVASHQLDNTRPRRYNVHILERQRLTRDNDGAPMVMYHIQNAMMVTDAPTTLGTARAVAETVASWLPLPEYFDYDQTRLLEWLVAELVWKASQRAARDA